MGSFFGSDKRGMVGPVGLHGCPIAELSRGEGLMYTSGCGCCGALVFVLFSAS